MFVLMIGVISILPGLYFLRIALLGMDPKNLSATVGTLVKASGYKNVPMKYGGVVKNQTDYAYAYTVGGKTYRCSGRKNEHRRTLPKKVTVVYVTCRPRSGYIEKYTGMLEWLYAVSGLFCGAFMLCLFFLDRL